MNPQFLILSSDAGVIFLFVAIILIVLFIGAYFGRAAIVKRKLLETPSKKIRDLQEGEISRVDGRVEIVSEQLRAPVSGRRCVYYHIIVEEERRGTKGGTYWTSLIDEEITTDVVINDGTGYALIDTEIAKSYIIKDREYYSDSDASTTTRMKTFLDEHNIDSTNWLGFNKRIRYREGILERGEKLAVTGKANWKKKSETKLDIPAERFLFIGPENQDTPVYLSDDPEVTG